MPVKYFYKTLYKIMNITKQTKEQKIKDLLLYLYENWYAYSKRALERRFWIDYRNYKKDLEKFISIRIKYNNKWQARHKLTLKQKYKKIILFYLQTQKWKELQIWEL